MVSHGRQEGYDSGVISQHLAAALRKARYEILPDDRSLYGEIQGFDGHKLTLKATA